MNKPPTVLKYVIAPIVMLFIMIPMVGFYIFADCSNDSLGVEVYTCENLQYLGIGGYSSIISIIIIILIFARRDYQQQTPRSVEE